MKRKDAQLIREVKGFLDEHLFENYSIPDLCRRFMINREKLQTGFQELTDSTVHAYVVNQRMHRASLRLIESDDSIKAVAIDSGYRKQRSFNKTFKSIFNITPAAFRRLHQHRDEPKT